MSQNNISILYAGVDIAKQSLQLDWDGQSHQLTNDPKGFAKLHKLLGPPGHCQVIMEATGGYERALAASLHEAGYALSILMPRRVRAFAQADAQLAKTDAIDAQMLRLFGQAIQPKPTPAPTAQQRRLQELALRRSQLVEAKTALINQAEHYEEAWTKRQARTQLGQLERFIAQCEEQIAKLLAGDERLAARAQRMQQVPGVGPITAAMLEAYLPELGTIDSNPAAALAGLAPYPNDSGPRNGPRSIRGGRKPARCALFMAAMSTIKHDAIFKAFYNRLRAAGKKPMVALTAVMRKLVVLLNRLLADPSFQLRAQKA
jgi:transposase